MTCRIYIRYARFLAVLIFFLSTTAIASAATLRVDPETGVYTVGTSFTVRVAIDTSGTSVNAAEGTISFNPRELSVVNVSRSSSIFNLWTQEPTFSNTTGTITFGGGSPTGYKGSGGTVISIRFRAPGAGSPKVTFTNGSVLAADGFGTNVLTGMKGASYTITAPNVEPEPEYVAPPNTPAAPKVTSTTHPDELGWYPTTTAQLSWDVPDDVVAVRTLLDEYPGTIPSIVYDNPITSRTIKDLPEGESYFHIQFKNSEGWGKVRHYRLGVDTKPPTSFGIHLSDVTEDNHERALVFTISDISPVKRYLIQLDSGDPIEYIDTEETGKYILPVLDPGHHTAIIEAFDAAGNSLVSTYAFDLNAFEKPQFTDYPTRLSNDVIPVFVGTTKPNVSVAITITKGSGEVTTYTVMSNENGTFKVIPQSSFGLGVYDMVAVATDSFGSMSQQSDSIRFIVEEPGYIRFGSMALNALSIIVPLIALLILLVFGVWYLWHRLRFWSRRIIKETKEAEHQLAVEFNTITSHLKTNVNKLKATRKGKLTKAENELIDQMRRDIDTARNRIHKEISDIDDVVE